MKMMPLWSGILLCIFSQQVLGESVNLKICSGKPDGGPCKASIPRFYFDRVAGNCQNFTFGGCGGNENNFKTKEECEKTCKDVPPCPIIDFLPPNPGCHYVEILNPEDLCPRNKEVCPEKPGQCPVLKSNQTGECPAEMICAGDNDCPDNLKCCFNGCGHACQKPKFCPMADLLPPPKGCRYIESINEDNCPVPTLFCTGGVCGSDPCGSDPCQRCINTPDGPEPYICQTEENCGNVNDCSVMMCKDGFVCKVLGGQGHCLMVKPPEQCLQPKETGPCRASMPRWFYNNETQKCDKFTYGGCKGNSNNFETPQWCSRVCLENRECLPPPVPRPPAGCQYIKKVNKEGCPEFSELICGKPGKCPLLKTGMAGICSEECQNDNDCDGTEKCCSNGCGHTCQMPRASCPMFKLKAPPEGCDYLDVTENGCPIPTLFCTGGACESQPCSGSCQLCINTPEKGNGYECKTTTGCDTNVCGAMDCLAGHQCKVVKGQGMCIPGAIRCRLPKSPGPCEAHMPHDFFNSSANQCQEFSYGGCAGNANRFKTKQDCDEACKKLAECHGHTCGSCEKCIPDPKQCITTPCPQYRCEKIPMCSKDLCKGHTCSPCQKCVPQPKMCESYPCLQYECEGTPQCQQGPCQENDCKPCEKCIPDPKQCFTTPCPQYRCEASLQCGIERFCEENTCRKCQKCVPEPKACKKEPCPQFKCLDTPECEQDLCANNNCKSCEECIPEPKQCITTPCPQYRCKNKCDGEKCESCLRGRCWVSPKAMLLKFLCRIFNPCAKGCGKFPDAECRKDPCNCFNINYFSNGQDVTSRC